MDNVGYKSQAASLTIRRTLCYIVLVILAFLSLFPFFILIVNATRSHVQIQNGFSALPGAFFGKNIVNLFSNKNIPILQALFNSVYVSLMTAVLTTYFSSMTAYGIYMYRFKGRKGAFTFIMAVMMVPTQVSTLGFIKLLTTLHMMDNLVSLYVPAIAAPIVFFYIYQAMESTLPYSIVEAARVDGCNEFRTFNTIVIPMMKPSIAVQAIFSFVSSWNNFFVPALVVSSKEKKTIPILIAQLRSADYSKFDLGQVYMQICIAIVPLIIVYLFLSRNIVSGATAGGVKE
ncbi:MAG: carbohydrate ABC transporter permease [Treponema sp.]|nr:carbohydrate ABC transporter permease [Treponema sp.]